MTLVSLTPTAADRWSIRRGNTTLFRELPLGPAIKLAREIARDEHLRRGHDTCVEMPGVGGPISLAQYVKSPLDATNVASGESVAI
ncbi:hypothetical protein [Rhodanobacter aciditrophus]|uniref:hypothetical protein n=1 Tax=Rhodanobacter aciditrophus TaxID=1623218 RepID=UPI003CF3F7A1